MKMKIFFCHRNRIELILRAYYIYGYVLVLCAVSVSVFKNKEILNIQKYILEFFTPKNYSAIFYLKQYMYLNNN